MHPRSWILLGVRVILGGLFVFAGVVKLQNPQGFMDAIRAFKLGVPEHLATLLTFAIPWTEILAGAMLVVGLWARAAATVIGAMVVGFLAGILSILARGLDVECGCFGKFEIPCSSRVGICHVARNAILLAMAVAVVALGPGRLAIDRPARS